MCPKLRWSVLFPHENCSCVYLQILQILLMLPWESRGPHWPSVRVPSPAPGSGQKDSQWLLPGGQTTVSLTQHFLGRVPPWPFLFLQGPYMALIGPQPQSGPSHMLSLCGHTEKLLPFKFAKVAALKSLTARGWNFSCHRDVFLSVVCCKG